MENLVQQLVSATKDIQLSRWLSACGTTLAIYDWMLLLDIEVATISRSKWTLPKFLYYYIRFVTAIFMCFGAFQLTDFRVSLSKEFCRAWVNIVTLTMFSTFVSSAWLFTLRLIALYRRNRYLVWFMYAFFFATYAASFGTLTAALVTYHKTVAYFEILNACGATEASHTFPALFYAPAAYEVFIFALTAWRAYQDASLISGAPFMRVLYRDGVIAFLVMTGVRGWNIWIYVSQPITALSIGTNIMWALNTILMTRVYLNLQWLAKGPTLGGDTTDLTTFASPLGRGTDGHPIRPRNSIHFRVPHLTTTFGQTTVMTQTIFFDLGTEPAPLRSAVYGVELRTVKEDEDVPHSPVMMAETLR